MNNIIRLLDDALEDSGVTTEAPEIGEDFRDIGKLVSDEVNLIETDDPQLDHKIAAVHEKAFVIVGPEATNVIQPATVSVIVLPMSCPKKCRAMRNKQRIKITYDFLSWNRSWNHFFCCCLHRRKWAAQNR